MVYGVRSSGSSGQRNGLSGASSTVIFLVARGRNHLVCSSK